MEALLTQAQVIWAVIIRETRTRFGRNRLGYIWALAEPILTIGMFAAMYTLLEREMVAGLPLVAFLVSGFIPFYAFQRSNAQAMNAISGNRGLLFYPIVRPLDLVIARTVLEVATYAVVFVLLMGAAIIIDGPTRISSLLMTTAGLMLSAGLGAALGLILCGLSVFSTAVERLVGPLTRPLFWMSALFFSTNDLPTDARDVVLFNPVLHTIELTRMGWFAGYDVPQVSFAYPGFWFLAMLYAGLILERVARRRMQMA